MLLRQKLGREGIDIFNEKTSGDGFPRNVMISVASGFRMAANENFAESLIGSIIILYGVLSSRGLIKPCFITARFMPVFVFLNLLSRLSDSLSIR